MTEKQIHPFDFSRLEKLSSRQVLITETLLKNFPQLSEGGEVASPLTEVLKRELNLALSLKFHSFQEASYTQFIYSLTSPCIAVLFKMQATEQRMVLEIDPALCRMLVDRLLGGEGKYPKELIPLSPVEEGVFEFLILKGLSVLRELPHAMASAPLQMVKVVNEPKVLMDSSSVEEMGCIFKFYLGLGPHGGYLQIYFPHPLVEGLFLRDDLKIDSFEAGAPSVLLKDLDRVSHIKTTIWSEIGRVKLMASEGERLEKGDVILFDEAFATMGPHGITGKTLLRMGEMSSGGWLGELVDVDGKVVVKILDYYGGE